MPQLIEVRFKGNRKEYFSWANGEAPVDVGSSVVVEVEKGEDLGEVTAVGDLAERKCAVGCNSCPSGAKEATGRVLRTASRHDVHLIEELRKAEEDVRRKVMERVQEHQLPMKVSDAEWQWDRKKLTVYFTADRRVDFRTLVRDLAALFRTRIELRQIGARDEAKRLDGVGRCGRQYCCSSWLPELQPVSLSLAKDQQLSLNPSQISGGCGRLLCCLRYEHDFYVTSRKRFPKEGKKIRTERGSEVVQVVDIFRERILLKAEDGSTRTVTLTELKSEVATQQQPSIEQPPSPLVACDDADAEVTTDTVVDAVTPRRSRRTRRPSHKRRKQQDGDGREKSSENSADPTK